MNKSAVSRDEDLESSILGSRQQFAILQRTAPGARTGALTISINSPSRRGCVVRWVSKEMAPTQERRGHELVGADPRETRPKLVRQVVVEQHLHSTGPRVVCAKEISR